MRFFLVVCIWIIIVGGLFGYTRYRNVALQNITQAIPEDLNVEGKFFLEVTSTFATEKDPFALLDDSSNSLAMEVRLNGVSLPLPDEEVQRGRIIHIKELQGVLQGHNELYVKASPPISENSLDNGVRLRLFEGDNLLIDKTVWGSGGSLVSGTVSFKYAGNTENDHDH